MFYDMLHREKSIAFSLQHFKYPSLQLNKSIFYD